VRSRPASANPTTFDSDSPTETRRIARGRAGGLRRRSTRRCRARPQLAIGPRRARGQAGAQAVATLEARMIVCARTPSTPARCQSQEGMRRQTAGGGRRACRAVPGGRRRPVPYPAGSSRRGAPPAPRPSCSRIAGTKPPSADHCVQCASRGDGGGVPDHRCFAGVESETSSSQPRQPGSAPRIQSAPGPHAYALTRVAGEPTGVRGQGARREAQGILRRAICARSPGEGGERGGFPPLPGGYSVRQGDTPFAPRGQTA